MNFEKKCKTKRNMLKIEFFLPARFQTRKKFLSKIDSHKSKVVGIWFESLTNIVLVTSICYLKTPPAFFNCFL